MRKSEQGTLSLLCEDVFEEIIRRIVNGHFNIYFDDDRYYQILSEHFLQGYEYDWKSLEPARCLDSEEDVQRIDEWLKFRKVWSLLEDRPCYHPLEEMLEKAWIAYFKAWILPNHDAAMVIDWILAVPLLGKNRTRSQIAELLGCTLAEQNKYVKGNHEQCVKVEKFVKNEHCHNEQRTNVNMEEIVQKKDVQSREDSVLQNRRKQRRPLRDLLCIKNDGLWESLLKMLDELQNRYSLKKDKSFIVWALYDAVKGERLEVGALELFDAFNDIRPSVLEKETFRKLKDGDSSEAYKNAKERFSSMIHPR